MKVLVTGTAGRVGRSIYVALVNDHVVVGLDRQPCSTADYVGDIRDMDLFKSALEGVDVVVHSAALHAPHVGLVPEAEFVSVNVEATESIMRTAIEHGIKHFVFTSTTALYGYASTPDGRAGWINEKVEPSPRTIYHTTKIEAERLLEDLSVESGIPVTALQMSRCFPEPADKMAIYRLNRGIDARDVASAHRLAIAKRLPGFRRFIISGATPFRPEDCSKLYTEAPALVRMKVPSLAAEFDKRGWHLPTKLDRVYDSSSAQTGLGWYPSHGFESVLELFDSGFSEVLPTTRGS